MKEVPTIGLIPSRLQSTRLPNKALLPIRGIPLVVHTMRRAMMAGSLDEVYVCTDSSKIALAVADAGGKFILTSPAHTNGTTRIAEAANAVVEKGIASKSSLFVDIQGDEPFVDPEHINEVVKYHKKNLLWDIVLPTLTINRETAARPSIVKVVKNNFGRVTHLSRAPIPYDFYSKGVPQLKHLSIISFTHAALTLFSGFQASYNEKVENIELMRAIDNGMAVGTLELDGDSMSVDLPEDYEAAKMKMELDKYFPCYADYYIRSTA